MYSKESNKQKAKEWYYANKEKALKRIKSYRLIPGWIEARKKYRAKWYIKNKSSILAERKTREWKLKHASKRKEYRSRIDIKLRNKKIKREWDLKNKVLINEKRRLYVSKKYKTDINHKLMVNISNQLSKGLKYNKLTKKNRTFVLLGYSVFDLKKHLESQFTSEMSWDNYGSYWHIDHKIPKSFATNEKELIELFKLDNLQPLEAKTNISKHNKYVADLFGSGSWFK